jgi:hypothetical protein
VEAVWKQWKVVLIFVFRGCFVAFRVIFLGGLRGGFHLFEGLENIAVHVPTLLAGFFTILFLMFFI